LNHTEETNTENQEIKREKEPENFVTKFGKHPRAFCCVPGLFRSLRNSDRKKILDLTWHSPTTDETIQLKSTEQLGANDLRVLQTLVAYSGAKGLLLTSDNPPNKQLPLFNDPKFEYAQKSTYFVKENMQTILAESGMVKAGNNYKRLKESLKRLGGVMLYRTVGTVEANYPLLRYAVDESDGRMCVFLNPYSTEVILGRNFCGVGQTETRELNDIALLMHWRLCGHLNYGDEKEITMDTLCEYVGWSETDNPNNVKARRHAVRKALKQLVDTGEGWTVTPVEKTEKSDKEKYVIFRPGRPEVLYHKNNLPGTRRS